MAYAADSVDVDGERRDRVDPVDRLPQLYLPGNYVAHNWAATWIGFDALLVAFMTVTAVLGWLRRQLVLLAAFTTGFC